MAIAMYRAGQGKWPRGISAVALGLIALFGVSELHGALLRADALAKVLVGPYIVPFLGFKLELNGAFLACVVVFVACGVGIRFMMNHPKTVDFLIDTGEEMQKAAWPWDPSAQGVYWRFLPNKGRELFNNSFIVIVGMFLVAGFLFAFDSLSFLLIIEMLLGGKGSGAA